nr:putative reverse transcriptase domain-containing protein [Tanacetum cinerariifolium]
MKLNSKDIPFLLRQKGEKSVNREADDGDVILDVVYDAIVAQEGVFSVDDEDVIPNKVYDAMVAQEGVFSTDDRDVIPNEVKSYADKRRKPLEFSVGDYVLLKVSPWKGVIRFGKKGKLAPRFVGPFEIIEKIGPVAYRKRVQEAEV